MLISKNVDKVCSCQGAFVRRTLTLHEPLIHHGLHLVSIWILFLNTTQSQKLQIARKQSQNPTEGVVFYILPRHGFNYQMAWNWLEQLSSDVFIYFSPLNSVSRFFSERRGKVPIPSPLLHMHTGQHRPRGASRTFGKDAAHVTTFSDLSSSTSDKTLFLTSQDMFGWW